MTPTEVKAIVQTSLRQRSDEGKTIRVVGLPVLVDGQWQVLVEPTEAEPTPRFHYYEMLGEVEDELSENLGVSVFLTPAPEGTYTYEVDGQLVEVKERQESFFVRLKKSPLSAAFYDGGGRYAGGIVGLTADKRSLYDEAVHRHLVMKQKAA